MAERDEARSVFISYRREDVGERVLHLRRALIPPLSEDQIFYDRESLHAGDRWKQRLADEIARCSVFVAMIGQRWLRAQDERSGRRRLDEDEDWVRSEIEIALERAAAGKLVIVPLLVDGTDMPKVEHLPKAIAALCNHQALSLRSGTSADWEDDIAKIRGVLTAQGVVAPADVPVVIDVDELNVDAIHFANEAAQTFTVTNTSTGTQKLGLTLLVSSVQLVDSVRLRKAGAVLREYTLAATLDAPGEIDLLVSEGVRVVLAPRESEAFRLRLTGSEGHSYACTLAVSCRNVETGTVAEAKSAEFTVVFPIRSLDVLRARSGSARSQ